MTEAVPIAERLEALAQIDALDCPAADKLVLRTKLYLDWYARESAAQPDPADPSGDTTWPPPTPPWPSLRGPRPGDDDMPVPTPTPWPQPGPGRMSH